MNEKTYGIAESKSREEVYSKEDADNNFIKKGDTVQVSEVSANKYRINGYPNTVALQVLKQGESQVVPFEACHVGIAGLPLALRGNGYSITDGSMNFLKKPGETIDQTYGIQFYGYMAARLYNGQIVLGNSSIATRLLGTDVISNKISVKGITYPTNTYADNNPKIRFNSEKENQNISLTFTDFNEVGGTASLTLNGNQGGEYFIAPYIKAISGFIGTIISPSDERIKKDINPLDDKYLKLIKKIQPVEFKYKDDSDDKTHAGFIAQRVQEAIQDVGLEDKSIAAFLDLSRDGKQYALAYTEFIPMLLAYCNDLQKQIDNLQKQIDELKDNAE